MKYLYKYVYKGHDCVLVVLQPEAGALPVAAPQAVGGGANGNNVPAARDEVQNYLDGRYVSASKTCHWFFAFDLHDMHPNVYHLAVHLPNEQTTYFPEGTTVGEAMMCNNSTTLTRWCDFNRKAKFEYAIATTLHRHCLLRWPLYTLIILKSLCGANPKRRGTSGKGQQGGGVQAEIIMSHWELWGTCTLCNPQRANVIICEFCLPTLQGPHALRTSKLPTGPTHLPQLCTPLLKLLALHMACCKMMLNGTSAFQKLLACNCPEAWGSFFPACWFTTTSPILGGCGTGIREPLQKISCTKHARWVVKRPPQRKCILQASLSLSCDGISCALLSSLNCCLETFLLNGRLLDLMY